jgi:hypothetical protein
MQKAQIEETTLVTSLIVEAREYPKIGRDVTSACIPMQPIEW